MSVACPRPAGRADFWDLHGGSVAPLHIVAVLLQPLGTFTPNAGGRRRSKEPPSVLPLAVREGIDEARTVWGLGHESTAPHDRLHAWGEVAPWALQLRVRVLHARLREVWAVYGPMTFAAPVAAGHEASTLVLLARVGYIRHA